MKQEKGKISALQLTFAVGCFIQGSTLVVTVFYGITKHESLFVFIIGLILALLIASLYSLLAKMFPQKNLIEINEIVFGRVLGKIISCIYVWFFLTLLALNLRDAGSFVISSILPETPFIAVLVTFMIICAFAVRGGIQVITRYSFLFMMFILFIVLSTTLLNLGNIELNNFKPMFSLKFMDYFHGITVVTVIPFGEIIIFLMFFSFVKEDRVKISKILLMGTLIGAITFIFVIFRDITVLGEALSYFSRPSFEAQRMIDLSEMFTRMEILFAIAIIFIVFFRISIIYYAVVLGLSQVLNLNSYRPLVLSTGAFVIPYMMILFKSPIDHSIWISDTAPIYVIVFGPMLIVITVITAKIRKKQYSIREYKT